MVVCGAHVESSVKGGNARNCSRIGVNLILREVRLPVRLHFRVAVVDVTASAILELIFVIASLSLSLSLHGMISAIPKLTPSNTLIPLFILFIAFRLFRFFSNPTLPKLKGPPNPNFIWGTLWEVNTSRDKGATYGRWAAKYGPVFEIPAQFGGRHIIISDPKAVTHFLSKDTFNYIGTNYSKAFIKKFFGPNIIYSENMDHMRCVCQSLVEGL